MAASSRLLWASRAAAYLRISTFPRAFSTGTYLSLLSVATLSSGVWHAVSCALVRGITDPCCWYGMILLGYVRKDRICGLILDLGNSARIRRQISSGNGVYDGV